MKWDTDEMVKCPIRVYWEWPRRGLSGIAEHGGYAFKEADYNPHADPPEGPGLSHYWWSDGNGGCDCNRSMFFAGEGWESNCGSEIRIYKIEAIGEDFPPLYPDVGGDGLPTVEAAEEKVKALQRQSSTDHDRNNDKLEEGS